MTRENNAFDSEVIAGALEDMRANLSLAPGYDALLLRVAGIIRTQDSRVKEFRKRNRRFRQALGYIAEEQDRGRADGLPEPGPAHDAIAMWAVAIAALKA